MQSTRAYQICTRCILSTSDDPAIFFDEQGICNHCQLYDLFVTERVLQSPEREQSLLKLINEIKRKGRGKKYDCIIGISGGVDSTYVAYKVKQLGLRPLAVHCDNGWNSELAVSNISNILNKLNIDLYTIVINWEEFKSLQLAYLKASVIDIEATSDHAIFASLYKAANKFGVKYILSGESTATEGLLPSHWVHFKNDLINIEGINNLFGTNKLKTFPKLGFLKLLYFEKIKRIKYLRFLDYINYDKNEAKKTISSKLNWRDYGGKHFESIITRFYQSYILPNKFKVDKRVSHLSTLICSGQITRESALIEIKKPSITLEQLNQDKDFVLKKLGLNNEEFNRLISLPEKLHTEYPSILNIFKKLRPLTRLFRRIFRKRKNLAPLSKIKRGKRVAMLLDNPYLNDNRVIQEATSLAKCYDLTIFCMRQNGLPYHEIKDRVKIIRIIPSEIFRLNSYWKLKLIAKHIASQKFSIVHCHDQLMLNLGGMIKKINPETILIYDSHEMFHSWPINFTSKKLMIILKTYFVRKIQIIRERKFSKNIDYLITVTQSIANILTNYFLLKNKPLVVRNITGFQELKERKKILREKFNIPENKKILVFIGANIYLKSRNIAQVLDEFGNKPDVVFIIISSDNVHRKEVENYVSENSLQNIYFHDFISYKLISDYLSGCDVGIISTWNKKDLSYWYALDNKMFAYMMAEIPILCTAQPEYLEIVEKYQIGVCINPEKSGAFYEGWQKIIGNYSQYSGNLKKAKTILNWENESEKLIQLYEPLVEPKFSIEAINSQLDLPRIAMLLDNSFTMDSRVYREAKTLISAGYPLTIYAVKKFDLPEKEIKDGIVIHRIFDNDIFDPKNIAGRLDIIDLLTNENFDIIHCHDQLMLYIGSRIKKQRPEVVLIYDSHELFHSWPTNYSNRSFFWVKLKTDVVRMFEVSREKRSANKIDRLITVSNSIGKDLNKYLKLKHPSVIVRNMAEIEDADSNKSTLRKDLNIPDDVKILLNFSLYIYWKSRNLEAVIKQFANKPGVALVFICGDGGNKNEIIEWVKESAFKNIYFHSAIQPEDIVNTISGADYGLLSTWNKKYLSYWYGLENKLFHYVMAELPILASAQPEHREIIEKYNIGVCINADKPDAYYKGFLELEKNTEAYKNNVIKSKQVLNWENEQHKLLGLYSDVKKEIYDKPRF